MNVLLDTTVLVASLVAAHPHHVRALPVALRVIQGEDKGHVSAHGLAETYAVLTTLPVSPRVGPDAARRLINDNILSHFTTVALTAREYERLVSELPDRAVVGGATYDAIHAACARKVDARRLYTFNVSDFNRLAPDLTEVITAP